LAGTIGPVWLIVTPQKFRSGKVGTWKASGVTTHLGQVGWASWWWGKVTGYHQILS